MDKLKVPWAKPFIGEKEKQYLNEALDSTWISDGPFVEKFEKDLSKRLGSKYCITTSSGTTAIYLALLATNIGYGDEVVIPAFSFAAACNMILSVGATPVFSDISPETWCLDPDSLKRSVTKRTKAVIPVHIYGNVCDMDRISSICLNHGLLLLEDTAEAAFSVYKDKFAGTFGQIGCFSFQATKTIAMGEGGAILTDSKELYDKMSILRNHGMKKSKRYWHELVGHNFRLTNLQAAIGCAQLDNLDKIRIKRAHIHDRYRSGLSGVNGLEMQVFNDNTDPVIWTVAVKINDKYFKGNRDDIMRELYKSGIETRPGFYPFSDMPIYKASECRVAQEISSGIICLPTFCDITDTEIDFISEQLLRLRK